METAGFRDTTFIFVKDINAERRPIYTLLRAVVTRVLSASLSLVRLSPPTSPEGDRDGHSGVVYEEADEYQVLVYS